LDNYSKARDRLKMSLEDLRRGLARYLEGDYPDAVFRFQLSVENACKSILSFLGIEFEKTHFPSVLIGRLVSDKERLKKLNLSREQITHLTLIISHASSLESQGSMPRYGWETEERIIMPSEVYVEDVAKELLRSTLGGLSSVVKFFNEFKNLPPDLSGMISQLRSVVDDASGKLG